MDTKGIGSLGVLIVLGVVLGGMGVLPTYEHNIAVQQSEPTDGVVLNSEVLVDVDDDGDESYHPNVEYEYTVDGETYTSDNTFPGRFDRWSSNRGWADDVVNEHPPGREVTVYYNPANPSQAYVTNDGLPSMWFLGALYVVLAVAGGIWLITMGFRRWRQRTLMADTPTETVRALSMGPSEVTGDAVTEDREPMSAPFSDDDCVVAKYEVKQYDEGDDDEAGSWETKEEGVWHTPFYVDDGTGSVLVEPSDEATFDLDPEDWSTTYVDSSDRGPAPIREYVDNHPSLGYPSNSAGKDNDRKYRQNLIRDGESVYVFGDTRPRDAGVAAGAPQEDRLVVQAPENDGMLDDVMFMISDDSEDSLTSRRRWALWRAPVGAAFLTAALCLTIAMFAPLVGLELPVLI